MDFLKKIGYEFNSGEQIASDARKAYEIENSCMEDGN